LAARHDRLGTARDSNLSGNRAICADRRVSAGRLGRQPRIDGRTAATAPADRPAGGSRKVPRRSGRASQYLLLDRQEERDRPHPDPAGDARARQEGDRRLSAREAVSAISTVLMLALLALAGGTDTALAGEDFSEFAFRPHPGVQLPLASEFVDEQGRTVPLGRFFAGKPVVLVLDYLR